MVEKQQQLTNRLKNLTLLNILENYTQFISEITGQTNIVQFCQLHNRERLPRVILMILV